MNLYEFSAYYLAMVATLLTIATLLLRRNVCHRWMWVVAIGGVGCFAALLVIQFQIPYDYKLFWLCGKDVLSGIDYYAIDPRGGRQMVLNPPTSLPLFELFASFSLRKGARIWTIANSIAAVALVPIAYRVLQGRNGNPRTNLANAVLGVITAVVVLSQSCLSNLALGQLSILTTLCILLALSAQDRGRPVLAGVWLTIASMKVVTMLPFLLLFTKRRDLPTWLTLLCLGFGLCLSTGKLEDLPRRLENNLRAIKAMSEEGRVNDYSYAGPSHTSMIAIDHTFYRMGLRDRGQIAVFQMMAVLAIGLFVARIVWDQRCPRGGAISLVSLYSVLFLYHRIYDALILVLPLVYCVGVLRNRATWNAGPFVACAALVIVVLSMYQRFIVFIETASFELGVAGRILQAAVLPACTWCLILAMVCLSIGLRREMIVDTQPV